MAAGLRCGPLTYDQLKEHRERDLGRRGIRANKGDVVVADIVRFSVGLSIHSIYSGL